MSTPPTMPVGESASLYRIWATQVRAFAQRYLRVLVRNRMVLFWGIGFPAGFYLLTISLFIDTSQIPADVLPVTKAVVAVAYGVFGALVVCMNAFSQHLAEDFEDGRYEQFRSLPISPTADLVGRFLASLTFSAFSFVTVLAIGAASGAEYSLHSPTSILVLVGSFTGFTILCMTIALVVAVSVTDSRYAGVIALSIVLLAFFVTGFNGTQVAMFAADAELLNLLPNSLATRVMVFHLVDVGQWSTGGLAPPDPPSGLRPLALLLGYGLVSLLTAGAVVQRVVYKREVTIR